MSKAKTQPNTKFTWSDSSNNVGQVTPGLTQNHQKYLEYNLA